MNTLHVKDSQGQPVKGWTFGTQTAIHVMSGQKPRKVTGWVLVSPDKVERFSEGNWQQFVPFAQRIVSNYGCTTNLS